MSERRSGTASLLARSLALATALLVSSCMSECGSNDRTPAHVERWSVLARDDFHARMFIPQRDMAYRPPTSDQHARVQELFAAVAHLAVYDDGSGSDDGIDALASAAGMARERWEHQGNRYWALLETPATRGQIGAFVFRVGPGVAATSELVLQAPHAYFDRGTGEIALDVFLAGHPRTRALFINTLHRYIQADGTKGAREHNPADVSHNPEHLFGDATFAVAATMNATEIVQIHGFGENTRIEERPSAWVVVSAGDKRGSSAASSAMAQRIATDVGVEVVRYPEDTRKLGATTNVTRRRLLELSNVQFVHVELSARFRTLLREGDDWIGRFAVAVAGGSEASR